MMTKDHHQSTDIRQQPTVTSQHPSTQGPGAGASHGGTPVEGRRGDTIEGHDGGGRRHHTSWCRGFGKVLPWRCRWKTRLPVEVQVESRPVVVTDDNIVTMSLFAVSYVAIRSEHKAEPSHHLMTPINGSATNRQQQQWYKHNANPAKHQSNSYALDAIG